jgi:L-rhamnose mutarotase
MERGCFLLKIKKDKVGQYLKAHNVWPEMLEALSRAGIKNYSLFMRDDGMAVGYLEAENIKESLKKVGQTDANRKWQEFMSEFFEQETGDMQGKGMEWLKPYFYLP